MTAFIDKTGKIFGKLTVVKKSEFTSKTGQTYWDCLCDCGNSVSVVTTRLGVGQNTRSCGCLVGKRSEFQRTRAYEKALKARENNPESVRKVNRKYKLKANYGLSVEQYNQMLTDQKGLCAICEEPLPSAEGSRGGSPPVDHNHITGSNRGIVHGVCNKALGLFKDSPELLRKAAVYLEKSTEKDKRDFDCTTSLLAQMMYVGSYGKDLQCPTQD